MTFRWGGEAPVVDADAERLRVGKLRLEAIRAACEGQPCPRTADDDVLNRELAALYAAAIPPMPRVLVPREPGSEG